MAAGRNEGRLDRWESQAALAGCADVLEASRTERAARPRNAFLFAERRPQGWRQEEVRRRPGV